MRKAVITSAGNMSTKTYKFICDSLEKKLGEEFDFSHDTSPDVIAGFIINIEGTVYDCSLGSQLAELSEYLR